jgi:capsid protein
LLPGDQVDASINMQLPDGGVIIHGIEYSARGEPRAYYILPTVPDAFFASSAPAVRVDVADIAHIVEPRFPGQRRGISWLHPILSICAAVGVPG